MIDGGGFTPVGAARAFGILDAFIYGWVLQERSMPFASPEEGAAAAGEALVGLPDGEYPNLRELVTDDALQSGFDFATEFEAGLELILDTLDRVRRQR